MKKVKAAIVVLFLLVTTSYGQNISKIDFKFSTFACDKDISELDVYSPPQAGVLKVNWIEADKLIVECFVKTYCAGATIKGDYEMKDNSLVLKYKIETNGPVTQCNCAHKVVYEFSNLPEKKDHTFIIIKE